MTRSAKQYSAFEQERTRTVRDLVAAIPAQEPRTGVDLGCAAPLARISSTVPEVVRVIEREVLLADECVHQRPRVDAAGGGVAGDAERCGEVTGTSICALHHVLRVSHVCTHCAMGSRISL